jgi:hypothetical protein
MNKKIIVVAIFGILVFSGAAHAQTNNLPNAGLTPESPFYFLDRWGETLQGFFTFSQEGKARLQVAFIAERAAELQKVLAKDQPNIRAVEMVFARIEIHSARATDILERLPANAVLATAITSELDFLDDISGDVVDAGKEKLVRLASTEAQALRQKLTDAAFENALEEALRRIAAEIDEEVGRPLEGFTVIQDEFNVDVDDDTYSATYRAEANEVFDLNLLKERILAQAGGWESGDVELEDDSLDITFEKEYAPVTIDGIEFYPDASVTISATINSPRRGMTAINYDVDITLETRSEHLADFLDEEMDDIEDALEEIDEEAEKHLEAEEAANRAIREAEEEKAELIDEAAEEGVELPANAFAEFDGLLAQAKSALAADNFVEAKNLAKRAEKSLDKVDKIIDELEKKKELKEEAEEAIQEAEEEKQEIIDEAAEEDVAVPAGAFGKFDGLLAQAKSALAAGNYEEAKRLAKQAEKSLDAVEKAIEDLEEAREKEEELKKEQEEKEREAKEEQDEKLKEEAEKEAERLEKERDKAEEEARKAEEKLREAGEEEGD